MKNKEEKVEFEITARSFVDGETGRGYGAGRWTLPKSTAEKFEAQGKGRFPGRPKAVQKPKDEDPLKGLGMAKEPAKLERAEQPLPEDFPERETLVEAGFGTVESLGVEGIREKLAKVQGLGPAKLNKIGVALEAFAAEELREIK